MVLWKFSVDIYGLNADDIMRGFLLRVPLLPLSSFFHSLGPDHIFFLCEGRFRWQEVTDGGHHIACGDNGGGWRTGCGRHAESLGSLLMLDFRSC